MENDVRVSQGPRLGLCLSGGGFRASFYHIGVLARMAELGMLRHVEIISTVSGGSILGAAYYIMLKNLLEGTPDGDLTDQHYVDLVHDLEKFFLKAVQKNLRLRTFGSIAKNIKMTFDSYSRSDSIGELYDKHIYRELLGKQDLVKMTDLKILGDTGKTLDEMNAERDHKIPILILNATSLNSGHNWYFSATRMGEIPPRDQHFRDMDKKDRYCRIYYDQITSRKLKKYPWSAGDKADKDFPLGIAVAASAGVPGLFPPVSVSDLFADRTVQLVDGGVYDNQGVAACLYERYRCTDFVISDASGQSDAINNPKSDTVGVLSQMIGVLTGRVREEMVGNIQVIENDMKQNEPNHVAYMHLKRGLFARDIKGNKEPVENMPGARMKKDIISSEQDFGVPQRMQCALSEIRTDLDSFSNLEARSLEADAYLMSEKELLKMSDQFRRSEPVAKDDWAFAPYIDVLKSDDQLAFDKLTIGHNLFMKPFKLLKLHGFGTVMGLFLRTIPLLLVLAAIIAAGVWAACEYIDFKALMETKLSTVLIWVGGILGYLALMWLLEKIIAWGPESIRWLKSISRLHIFLVKHLAIPLVLFLPIQAWLKFIDPYFVNHLSEVQLSRSSR